MALLVAFPTASVDAAFGTLVAISITNLLFSGFYVRQEDVPVYLKWLTKISFIRYSLGANIINNYDSDEEGRSLKLRVSGEQPMLSVAIHRSL